MALTILGIDYSMTSPAMCIHIGDTWEFKNCRFFYKTGIKKLVDDKQRLVQGELHATYKTEEERFYQNALWVEKYVKIFEPVFVAIEGYAMGAKGKVFHIGENTGVLKHVLWRNELPFIVPPPSVIKKFATGKGNANKEAMEAAFVAETSFDVRKAIGQSENTFNPSSDIIDAYYMCKYAFHNRK